MSRISMLLGSLMQPRENDRVSIIANKPGFLTPEECARVVALAEQQEAAEGGLNVSDGVDHKTRKSTVAYLLPNEQTSWLYEKIGREVQAVNQDAYNYKLNGIEAIQVATYEEGGHYTWHMDLGAGNHSTRKLSMTIQLTDPNEYEGGGLEFMKVDTPIERGQGSVIFFPSFYLHRVQPVTRGMRKSLVAWIHGDAFS